MKKKLLAILMVMLIIGGSVIPTSVHAESQKRYMKINKTVLEFDEIIYVDEATGDDTTADGTLLKPYKTLEAAVKTKVVIPSYSYCFKLGDGNYVQSKWLRSTISTNEISVIGNGKKTILTLQGPLHESSSGYFHLNTCDLAYYDLVWQDQGGVLNANIYNENVSINNVVFNIINPPSNYILVSTPTKMNFDINNCVRIGTGGALLRSNNDSDGAKKVAKINVSNSYGAFTSGYNTIQSEWDYQTNYITVYAATIDENYNITEPAEKWKNAGTGQNPDGTQANIGVYGGPFAWGGEPIVEVNDPTIDPEPPTTPSLQVVLEKKEVLNLSIFDDLSENEKVSWVSSDTNVATVDTTGSVTAIATGSAIITVADASGDYTESIKVLVVDNAKSLRLAATLKTNKTCRLTVGDLITGVTWKSTDDTIATVSDKGIVTAHGKGLAMIVAEDSKQQPIGIVYIRVME